MNIMDDYESWTKSTAVYPEAGKSTLTELTYLSLGLVGEAGEVANKVKKLLRDQDSPEKRAMVLPEIGDVLWYLARLTSALGSTLNQEALKNREKLEQRKERGVLQGNGDNR